MNRDELIGKNLQNLRGDMSQKELADKMRALGWKWSQATVWSIEKGERPLRLAEADALFDVLKLDGIEELLKLPAAYSYFNALQRLEETEADLRQLAIKWPLRLFYVAAEADAWEREEGEGIVEKSSGVEINFSETVTEAIQRLWSSSEFIPAPRALLVEGHSFPNGKYVKQFLAGGEDVERQEEG
ncbi:helix-turn-helix domain-containing protein [Diaminobutyricimonas sp. LJ205]|uniref:helix-turn-helix domain-containing protein n=1 Tax=Diaminobutyricimonas sp. LJ205 TaxID=2683590 RepID=UPI0012F5137C|nr:helix-turn-helix transcriptional regulator [Diaminobutyricimonas sp. LJ205]